MISFRVDIAARPSALAAVKTMGVILHGMRPHTRSKRQTIRFPFL